LVERGLLHPAGADGGIAVMPEIVRDVLGDGPRAAEAHTDVARAALRLDPGSHALRILEHARRGGAWDVLATFWSVLGPETLRRHPDAVRAAYADIPEPALREHPTLAFAQAICGLESPGDAALESLATIPFRRRPTVEEAR